MSKDDPIKIEVWEEKAGDCYLVIAKSDKPDIVAQGVSIPAALALWATTARTQAIIDGSMFYKDGERPRF
jgi:hypothetical protein